MPLAKQAVGPICVSVTRFHAGDSDLFLALHAGLSPRLARVARSFGLSSVEVDDAVQDTWVRAFERRSTWRGDGNLWSWLAHICRGVCVDRIRSRRAEHLLTNSDERLPSALVAELPDPIDDGFRSQALGDWIDDQIRAFSPAQRNAAALRWLLHWPVNKIAETLGVTPGTVKTELFRARRTIARRLADPKVIATLGIDPQLLGRHIGEHK
jgi:RNA polymerase sigma-70 factor (ECF subfamily)